LRVKKKLGGTHLRPAPAPHFGPEICRSSLATNAFCKKINRNNALSVF
jgi:ribosomal protein L11